MNIDNQALKDLPAFYWTAKLLNMSLAAEKLDMTKATVSKAVSRLEALYQVRLMERNSRNIRLTPEGQTLLEYADRVLQITNEATHALTGMQQQPQGTVNLAVPLAFSREVIAPNLARFRVAFPDIQLKIQTSHHPMDVLRDEVDIAVLVGSIENSDLIAKTLYPSRLKWVVSPAYLRKAGAIQTPEELERHIQFCETRYHKNKFKVLKNGLSHTLNLADKSSCNDPIVIREAVLSGCGVSMLPDQYCNKLIRIGDLIEICNDIIPNEEAAELKIVYPSRLYRSKRVRAVTEFIESLCKDL